MLRRLATGSIAISWAIASATIAAPPKGEQPAGMEAPDISELMKMAEGAKPPGGKDKDEFPPFDEVTKDMESKKGLFTLWSYPASAENKDKEKLLCQIPSSFLGEKFMLSTSFSGGGFFTGFPLEETVVQWQVQEKQLVLIQPETGFITDEKNTVSDVVRRTYPDRIRAAVPIVTKTSSGDPVIDLGVMLKGNFADIAWMSAMDDGPMSMMRGGVNSQLSKWTKRKTFELNVEIGVELAMNRMSPPGSFDKKQVHFSFWKLPQSDYEPRVADDRVGYFLTTNRDWSKPTDARDIFNRYIDRWHLVKRDASLANCEPKQPIIYYIEKTVPVRFRRAVRDGILEWNKAYEKVGFVNAVEVRQQTDDNEWKDLDPEDMRYSFFRWIVTGAGFAMGPHRANPFTGQIYDADIIFDDSMVRYYENDVQEMLPTAALVARKMSDPVVEEFMEKHPQWKPPIAEWGTHRFGDGEDSTVMRKRIRERMRTKGLVGCDYAEGMKHQLALGQAVLAGQPPEVVERFLYDMVKEVVMHEVGHTLGLRHNFKASSIYSLDEIKRRRTTNEPTVGSVMDYNASLFFADKTTEGRFITPTVGPYDLWAIEYGYRPADGSYKPKDDCDEPKTPEKEEKKSGGLAAAKVGTDGDLPKDVMDKLPPEIRKMLEAKGGAAAMAVAPSDGPKKPSGPSFKGPNADELDMLHKIASRAAEPELAYATDEDTTILGPDPRSNRFDMASDPMEWAQARLDLVNKRLDTLMEWSVKEGESWSYLRRGFINLMIEKVQVMDYVGRYIDGDYTSRSHRGDSNGVAPLQPIDPAMRRKAMAFLEKNIFRDDAFAVKPEVLNHLASARWWHEGANVDFQVDFAMHDFVAFMQWWTMFDRLFPNTLRRLQDAELRTASGGDRFTVAEYLQRLQQSCWSDAVDGDRVKKGGWSDASPMLSSTRRSLQRTYLMMVEPLVRMPPGWVLSPDLHAMVQSSLKKLATQINTTRTAAPLDFASEAHLASCQSRIERMLTPELKEFGGEGGH